MIEHEDEEDDDDEDDEDEQPRHKRRRRAVIEDLEDISLQDKGDEDSQMPDDVGSDDAVTEQHKSSRRMFSKPCTMNVTDRLIAHVLSQT